MKNLIKSIQNSKLTAKITDAVSDVYRRFSDKVSTVVVLNAILIVAQILYLNARYEFVNDLVPFWYTRMWGDLQFGQKRFLYFIPLISSMITLLGLAMIVPIKRYYVRYGISVVGITTVFSNLLLTGSLIRIILVASKPFEPDLLNKHHSPQFAGRCQDQLQSHTPGPVAKPVDRGKGL